MNNARKIIERIRSIADGRRHYDGTEGYTCFDALGEIRDICDQVLGRDPWQTSQEAIDQINAFFDGVEVPEQ